MNHWVKLVRDRINKQALYGSPGYWDGKADTYQGLAQSNWPSNAYNACMHDRQMQVLDTRWADITGWKVADVGCGTGRTTRHLARRGAHVTGFDFSEKALAVAERETTAEGLEVELRATNILDPAPPEFVGKFDGAITIGCLAIACSTRDDLSRALAHIAQLVRPGGRVLLMEPAHGSPVLARMLRLSDSAWVHEAEKVGLALVEKKGILFAPARFFLAFRDLPQGLVDPIFKVAENLMDRQSTLEAIADYKVMYFARTGMSDAEVGRV